MECAEACSLPQPTLAPLCRAWGARDVLTAHRHGRPGLRASHRSGPSSQADVVPQTAGISHDPGLEGPREVVRRFAQSEAEQVHSGQGDPTGSQMSGVQRVGSREQG